MLLKICRKSVETSLFRICNGIMGVPEILTSIDFNVPAFLTRSMMNFKSSLAKTNSQKLSYLATSLYVLIHAYGTNHDSVGIYNNSHFVHSTQN